MYLPWKLQDVILDASFCGFSQLEDTFNAPLESVVGWIGEEIGWIVAPPAVTAAAGKLNPVIALDMGEETWNIDCDTAAMETGCWGKSLKFEFTPPWDVAFVGADFIGNDPAAFREWRLDVNGGIGFTMDTVVA